jgi:hypothetical protein
MKNQSTVPSQLFVGSEQKTSQQTEKMLQVVFCIQTGDEHCFCVDCRKIKQRQHHGAIWIVPEKGYGVDDIEIVFERIRFALDPGERFFFILTKAETLNVATANRLLKVLEEPPTGYHFILHTTNERAILPTILSRSVVTTLDQQDENNAVHPLLTFFLDEKKQADFFAFEALLKKEHLSDSQSYELACNLLEILNGKKKATYQENNEQIRQILSDKIQRVTKHLLKPPQSGSSDIFWKNLFLALLHS